jgi:multidrug efflux pump subunit AcrB
MLFESYQNAKLYSVYDTSYINVLLNYNGLNQELEVEKSDDEFIILNSKFYNLVEIEDQNAPNGKIVMKKDLHPSFEQSFLQVIYESEKIKVVKYFKVRKSKVTINDVGKIRNFENFTRTTEYFIINRGALVQLKIKKKPLLNTLGYEDQLEDYIKKENLDLDSDIDLNKLFTFFDSL